MAEQQYARIHPDARNDKVPVRLYDVAGKQFVRGEGDYKGWYKINADTAERLRRCHVSNGNPNSMRVFQIEGQKVVDEISAAEGRSRMAPEMQRIDKARDAELAALKKQMASLEPLLALFGDPEKLQRLVQFVALEKAATGQALTNEESERVARVAEATPRRPPMNENDLNDDNDISKRTATTALPTATRSETKPAPAPPARPGAPPARPGAKKEEAKKDAKKDEPKPVSTSAASLPPSLPSDISAVMDPALLEEDDDHDV
jgi:hypothetical protein